MSLLLGLKRPLLLLLLLLMLLLLEPIMLLLLLLLVPIMLLLPLLLLLVPMIALEEEEDEPLLVMLLLVTLKPQKSHAQSIPPQGGVVQVQLVIKLLIVELENLVHSQYWIEGKKVLAQQPHWELREVHVWLLKSINPQYTLFWFLLHPALRL
jgi:hypothetical protein